MSKQNSVLDYTTPIFNSFEKLQVVNLQRNDTGAATTNPMCTKCFTEIISYISCLLLAHFSFENMITLI